jgi:protein-disulfide isomerase
VSRDEERDEERENESDAEKASDERASDETEAEEAAPASEPEPAAEKKPAKKAEPKAEAKAKSSADKSKAEPKSSGDKSKAVSASDAPARKPSSSESKPSSSSSSATPIYVLGALLIGGGAGWFGRGSSATAMPTADAPAVVGSAAAPGDATTCSKWADEVCTGAGAQSEGCAQAKGAAELLTEKACSEALNHLPMTMEKLKNARSSCDELVVKICNDIGKETETCKMVTETTKRFPPKQCKDMLQNFGEVMTELRQLEKQNGPIEPAIVAAQRAGDAPGFGPVDAKLAIVEYSDFECPFCTRAAATVSKLKEKYGDKVRFVFRQYPLPMHRNAEVAAQASLEAHAQGKFWQLHDLMFENQRTLDRAKILELAKKAGMDVKKLEKALDDGTHAAAVQNDMKLGDQIGVSGTPTMIVGDKRVQNPTDFDAIASMVDAELARLGN